MGVKVLPQKRTVIIITVLFWGNTFTPMGLQSSGYGIQHCSISVNDLKKTILHRWKIDYQAINKKSKLTSWLSNCKLLY